MKLEMDSTIQYAKGSEEKGWWTQISNKDKKIKKMVLIENLFSLKWKNMQKKSQLIE